MNKSYYITTPIYYVNGKAHIGHAYTTVIGDCIKRFKILKGDKAFYLTGTDEHGEKIKKAAAQEGRELDSFIDNIVSNFKQLWSKLNISYDCFIRTTDQEHIKTVQEILKALYDKGDIYKENYQGFQCLPCELFWIKSQLVNNLCPDCGRAVEPISEESYFFRLSKYQTWLIEYLKANPDFVRPKIRYNEVMSFLENNTLTDLCISRPKSRVSWGIDLPIDNNYIIYVWFDALINYISAIGYTTDQKKFKSYWPADLQLMAKDIIRQHAVIWPIMLKAIDLPMPKIVLAHGWWKIGGEKMSKSRGNVVNPFDLINSVGVDGLRYFLLREVELGWDGNFSWDIIIARYNSDLANDLGNLVYRTLNMTEKYFSGNLKVANPEIPEKFRDSFTKLNLGYITKMDNLELSSSLVDILACVSVMNKYIEEKKPWALAKENKEAELKEFIYSLLEGIRLVGIYLYPFIPSTSQAIIRQLGLKEEIELGDCNWGKVLEFNIKKENPLFPRIDVN